MRFSTKLAAAILFAVCLQVAVPAHAQFIRTPHTFETSAGPVTITPIYHASTLLQANGKNIYLDPYTLGNFDGLPPADLILISHTHADHMDPGAIALVSKPETQIWAPAVVIQTVTTAKLISNGETKQWNGWSIEAMPAYNIKNGDRHKKGVDNAYILTYGGQRFYFSADTESIPEMRALKNIDAAFVCMNYRTMPPEEAADAVKAFHPKYVIPYHYKGSDTGVFQKALQGTGIDVLMLNYYPEPADQKY
jgi:L-ascorbate metabolism protein UlaG (beta-lactamase superfamily)